MDADLKSLYARTIETSAGKCFCVVVSGPEVDDDGFDVTVFHARSMRTYIGKGLRAPPRWIKPDLWMPLALRALASEAAPEGVRFSFHPDTGALSWTWPAKEVGMSAGAQQSVALRLLEPGPAPAAGAAGAGAGQVGPPELEEMLATVWESCYRLLLSCRQLDTQLARQADALGRTRRELQECTEKHKGLVEELHIKFARVLDAKKEKLIEQRDRIQELEAQLQAARQELAEAEAAHTDEEGEEEQPPGGEAPPAARPLPSSPTTTAAPPRTLLNGREAGPSSLVAAPALRQGVATDHNGGGAAAAGAPGSLAVGGGGLDEMDWDLGVGVAPRGLVAPAAAAAASSPPPPPQPLGGTYASLGSTQIDEELLMAATQPAARVAPAPTGADTQQLQQPSWQQQTQQQQQQQAQQQPQQPVASGAAASRKQPPGLGHPPGAAGAGAAGAAGGAAGRGGGGGGPPMGGSGAGGLYEDGDEEEDDDDDAALGLVGRR